MVTKRRNWTSLSRLLPLPARQDASKISNLRPEILREHHRNVPLRPADLRRHRARRRIHTIVKIAQQRVQVSVPVLLVHRHVNHRIQTRSEIDQNVTDHVQRRTRDLRVEGLHQRDRQVADDEAEEDQEDHLGDVHLAAPDAARVDRRRRSGGLVHLHPLPAPPDHPVDPGVADDDDGAGDREAQDEEADLRAAIWKVGGKRVRRELVGR